MSHLLALLKDTHIKEQDKIYAEHTCTAMYIHVMNLNKTR